MTMNMLAPSRIYFSDASGFGSKQTLTPEGFLLCEDVPIARTGELLYVAGEVPVEAASDGLIRIMRYEADVFSPVSMASFVGKPVTVEHPDDQLDADNWSDHAVGTIIATRRGTDSWADFLLADFIIQDAEAIDAARSGKRQLSCGYDADYIQTGPGRGRQTSIIGNHLALVTEGRCGPRCAINGRLPITRDAAPARTTARDEALTQSNQLRAINARNADFWRNT